MQIPYLDLSVKDAGLKSDLLESVERVLSHGRIVLGPEVEEFETRIGESCQKKFAVGVNSGSDALYLALRSLDVGPGDEVVTTPLSWVATLNAIVLCGATPVFADVGEDLNIDPDRVSKAITPRTKAIVPVHFTGRLCDITRIVTIADGHNVAVVEDAAQAFGASFHGRMAGSFGLVNTFSMNPMKVLNAYGEAGAVVTDDEHLYEKLTALRYSGTVNREDCHYPSLNGRIDTIQAAMLIVSLQRIENKIARRREIAGFYSQLLGEVVATPTEKEGYQGVFYTYTILADRRDGLKQYLGSRGIETKIQHPILMPYHTAYRHLPKPDIPVAERLLQHILCIPNHENLTDGEIEYIAGSVRQFYGE